MMSYDILTPPKFYENLYGGKRGGIFGNYFLRNIVIIIFYRYQFSIENNRPYYLKLNLNLAFLIFDNDII